MAITFQIDSDKGTIMSSCVKPLCRSSSEPVVLLHGFDRYLLSVILSFFSLVLFYLFPIDFLQELSYSSCLEWRYVYPLLEDAGVETWAIDILGWGFSDLGILLRFLTACNCMATF
jgi:hypothetical protein